MSRLLTIASATFVAFIACGAVAQTIPAVERKALEDVFRQTSGGSWEHHDRWLTELSPCDWFGVMCGTPRSGIAGFTVIGISLPYNNLKGAFPQALHDLSNLQHLDLRGNHLAGRVTEAYLEAWDRNEFELFLSGNNFENLVRRVQITSSASGLLCARDVDVHFSVELNEDGSARFKSVRCAGERGTYCLVKQGEAPTLVRLGQALRKVGFEGLAASYDYPYTGATHQTFVTTRIWWGDGHMKELQTYGEQGPIEAYIAEQLVFGIVNSVVWKTAKRSSECRFE